ncbi:MarR family winged helix-turn-helix transcriptional regulator [Paenibacillus sp. IHBB 10380]|uniref:MarR family winged helix-turn-helix transcriptional regulator n=1 Tax=Paenibacillus sp. IHBB 10380 TaxID=1566358 RepID=UPI0005CFEEA9|nr:MarR family transcriptional regulator [Paenibacillus sp. IHBB 10380]AJS59548.1 MarR family transcriptional regulator [Paenibacillus sp. IHBB 10380]
MENTPNHDLITSWLTLTHIQMNVANKLEANLQEKHQLSLKEFYLLLFLSEAPETKLKLQQLESMLGLSQSAVSRLVSRFEAKGCGALKRHACDDDRRSIYTSLTQLGQDKLDRAQGTFEETLLGVFPEKDVESLLQQMLRMKQQ